MQRTPLTTEDQQERVLLSQVLQKIGNPQFDLFIVGDGSGTGWNAACGWACTLIERRSNLRRFFYGGMDCGSVNLAEAMPYLQAMTWYDITYGKDLLRTLTYLRVVILTDSQVTAQWGNRAMTLDTTEMSEVPRKQLAIYSAMRALRKVGYHCTFYWAPRLTTELNWAADIMAGLTRKEIIRSAFPEHVAGSDHATRAANALDNLVFYHPETGMRLTPYDINPLT